MALYLCPVCRAPRKKNLRDRISFHTHLVMAILVSVAALVVYVVSGLEAAWKTLFFYLPLWALIEFVHGVKMRQATECEVCSFDPVLYQRDWRAARTKVEQKLGTSAKELKNRINERVKVSSGRVEKIDKALETPGEIPS